MSTIISSTAEAGQALRAKFFEEAARLAPVPVCIKSGGLNHDGAEYAPQDYSANALDFAIGLLRSASRPAQARFFAYVCESIEAHDLLVYAPYPFEQVAGLRFWTVMQSMVIDQAPEAMLFGAPSTVQNLVQCMAHQFGAAQAEGQGESPSLARRYLVSALEKLQLPMALACKSVYGSRVAPIEPGGLTLHTPPTAQGVTPDSGRASANGKATGPKSLTATLIREGREARRLYAFALTMGFSTKDF